MRHKKCIRQTIIKEHIIQQNLFCGPYLNLIITGRSKNQLIVPFIVDTQYLALMTVHGNGPPATELLRLPLVIYLCDLELALVKNDHH